MIPALSVAASALQANATRLEVHANNVANVNSTGFKAKVVSQQTAPGGGVQITSITDSKRLGVPTDDSKPEETNNVDLVTETVGSMLALRAFEANAKMIQTADEMMKTLNETKKKN